MIGRCGSDATAEPRCGWPQRDGSYLRGRCQRKKPVALSAVENSQEYFTGSRRR